MNSYWDVTSNQCLPRKSNGITCILSVECLELAGLGCVNTTCQCLTQNLRLLYLLDELTKK